MFFLNDLVEKSINRRFYFTITVKNMIIANLKMPFNNRDLKKTYI